MIVATTPLPEDKEIIQIALNHDCSIFVGGEIDVAKRVYWAARLYKVDVIVRVTVDCPLMDPEVIDLTIQKVSVEGFDYAASRLEPWAYPDGLDVDVVKTNIFSWCAQGYINGQVRIPSEHIMEPLKQHPLVKKSGLPHGHPGQDFEKVKWSLDDAKDYEVIKNIYDFYHDAHFTFHDLIRDFVQWKTKVTDTTYLHKVGVAPHPPDSFKVSDGRLKDNFHPIVRMTKVDDADNS